MKTAMVLLMLLLPAVAWGQVDSLGACCFSPGAILDLCRMTTQAGCDSLSGLWYPPDPCITCWTDVCAYYDRGACCTDDGGTGMRSPGTLAATDQKARILDPLHQ